MSSSGMEFSWVSRAKLKLNPVNPKEITEESVALLAKLIQRHGFRDPIEARVEDCLILTGHRRFLAAERLGIDPVPVIWHYHMSDEAAKAYTIAHTQSEKHVKWNRSLLATQLGELPEDLSPDLLGFSEKEIASLFDLDLGEEREAEEKPSVEKCWLLPGDVWIIGEFSCGIAKGLRNDHLIKCEAVIRKISKMLKKKPLLDGDEARPLDVVLKERALEANP